MRGFLSGATTSGCAAVALAIGTLSANAASIESITYTIQAASTATALNTVSIIPGGTVTFTPLASSLNPGSPCTGPGYCGSISLPRTLSFSTPLDIVISYDYPSYNCRATDWRFARRIRLTASSATNPNAPIAIAWQRHRLVSGPSQGIFETLYAATTNLSDGAPLYLKLRVAHFYCPGTLQFNLILGNEVRTFVPEPSTPYVEGVVLFALIALSASRRARRSVRPGSRG
jgi:hypothetical protein